MRIYLKILKLEYWIKKLDNIKFKRRENQFFENSSKLRGKILQEAQNKFKKNINANIIREIEDKIHRRLTFIDCSNVIIKGYIEKEEIIWIRNNQKKYKIKIEVKELK